MAAQPLVRPAPPARRIVLPVAGMHCASCVSKIEKAAAGVKGVDCVSVNLASRTVAVVFRGAWGPDEVKAVKRSIEKAGYDVLGQAESFAEAESLSLLSQQAEQKELLGRLYFSLALSLLLLSAPALDLSQYTVMLLAVPLQVWGGLHFHQGFYRGLIRYTADMNTLVSLSTWAAFLYSSLVVLMPEIIPPEARRTQWDVVAGLITMVTFGKWLEARTRGKANEAVIKLMRIAPKTVRVLRAGQEENVPLAEVEVGETIVVRPGEQVGLDGVVTKGASTVDESLITGEGMPVEKAPKSRVLGGTINKTGMLEVRVDRPGSESALARIIEAVRSAQASKPRIQKFVDSLAAVFVPLVVLIGAGSAVLWAVYGPEPKILMALTSLVSVLAVSCPCALGLATPLAVVAGMGRAAQMGVFIRDADALEKVRALDVILFDKTGTLTEGKPRVVDVIALRPPAEMLRYAVAAEQRSEHPFAAAVLAYGHKEKAVAAAVDFFEAFPGRGVLIRSEGRTVRVGSLAWLEQEGCSVPPLKRKVQGAASILGVSVEGEFFGAFVLSDALKPSAKAAVAALSAMGLEVILASGDRRDVVHSIAEEAGIRRVFAEVLPEEKASIVARLQAEGKRVAMVGEGFNDAPALSQADLGIALGTGTDVAIEAADMTVINTDLTTLALAVRLSQRIYRVIRQNLFWAFAYNVVLIPIAAGALYSSFGVLLRPQYAGAAMVLSSVSVVLNSLRLRRIK